MTDFAAARRTMVDGQLRTVRRDGPGYSGCRACGAARALCAGRRRRDRLSGQRDCCWGRGQRAGCSSRWYLPRCSSRQRSRRRITCWMSERVLGIRPRSSAISAKKSLPLEEDRGLARHARQNLAGVGAQRDGGRRAIGKGLAGGSPYDVIVLNGAAETGSPGLFEQLKPTGRLVAIVGGGPAPKATLYRLVQGQFGGLAGI